MLTALARSTLVLLFLAASALAQTDITKNAFGTGAIGPAVWILDAQGKVGVASLGANLSLVKNPTSGALTIEFKFPNMTFRVKQISPIVAAAGATYTLPSLPLDVIVVGKNGAILSPTTDYIVQDALVTFVPAHNLKLGDTLYFCYTEKVPVVP